MKGETRVSIREKQRMWVHCEDDSTAGKTEWLGLWGGETHITNVSGERHPVNAGNK